VTKKQTIVTVLSKPGMHNMQPTKTFLAARESFLNYRKCWKLDLEY